MKKSHNSFGWLRPLALLSPAALALAGCGVKLEKNPLFQDQLRIVERLDEDSKAMTRQIEEMGMDVKNVQTQLASVGKGPQADPAIIRSLEQRVAALERSVNESGAQLAALGRPKAEPKAVAELASAPKPVEASRPKGHKASQSVPAVDDVRFSTAENPGATIANPRAGVGAVKGKLTRSGAEAPKSATRGFYYLVQNGETFDSIAGRNRIATSALLAANHVPAGRSLMPGQQIYVPAAK